MHFVPVSCRGEQCQFVSRVRCSKDAAHKVGEEILHDDPQPCRHNLTSYLCCRHYRQVMGGTCNQEGN